MRRDVSVGSMRSKGEGKRRELLPRVRKRGHPQPVGMNEATHTPFLREDVVHPCLVNDPRDTLARTAANEREAPSADVREREGRRGSPLCLGRLCPLFPRLDAELDRSIESETHSSSTSSRPAQSSVPWMTPFQAGAFLSASVIKAGSPSQTSSPAPL
jgi:hypothetical protein